LPGMGHDLLIARVVEIGLGDEPGTHPMRRGRPPAKPINSRARSRRPGKAVRPMRPLLQRARSCLISGEVTAAADRTGRFCGRKMPRSTVVIAGSAAGHSRPARRW
jgi:hypothetical protein